MRALRDDLLHAVATWKATPFPAAVAVATLGLGIGVTTAVFSVANAVLLAPLPFPEADRLVVATSARGTEREAWPASYPDLLDLRTRSRSFTGFAAVAEARLFKLWTAEGPVLLTGDMVSAGYFSTLGVAPLLGRAFLQGEDAVPGEGRVAVLSHATWRLLGNDPDILGDLIELDDVAYEIIGVMPPGFRGLTDDAEVWLPISMAATLGPGYLDARQFRWLSAVGRLRPGVDAKAAGRELAGIAAQLSREHPDSNHQIGVSVTPLAEVFRGELRAPLLMLGGASSFVLLLACTNVTNLLLSRSVKRQGEIALRAALGATHGRLGRQLQLESLLLAGFGCCLGLALAWSLTPVLLAASGLELAGFFEVEIDLRVIAVALGTSMACGVLTGLAPAALLLRGDLQSTLRGWSAGVTRGLAFRRLQSALIPIIVALAIVLLIGGGLMAQGLARVVGQDLGFDPRRIIVVETSTRGKDYADDSSYTALIAAVLGRLSGLSGIEALAFEGPGTLTGEWHGMSVVVEERRALPSEETLLAMRHHVSPGYFTTLGIPLLAGREITASDHEFATPVAVVSETLARRLWPGRAALGQRLKLGTRDAPRPWLTVVGIVGDVRHEGWADERPGPDLYLPLLQSIPRNPPMLYLLVRSAGRPESLFTVLRHEFASAAPALPVREITTLERLLKDQVAGPRFLVLLMTLFAAFALALAAVGIYSLISWLVGQRAQEIGIRIALGAGFASIVRSVSWPVVRLVLLGLLFGLVGSLALVQVLANRVEGIGLLDPWLAGGALLVLLVVALAASWLPAYRAARTDPRSALRTP